MTWYYQWNIYKRKYFDVDCTTFPLAEQSQCDQDRNAARKTGTIYWEICNIANFIAAMALVYILHSLGNAESKQETKKVKVLKKPKDNPEDEIERITETLDEVEKSVSSMTYTYLGKSEQVPSSINDDRESGSFMYGTNDDREFTEVEVIVENEVESIETRIWAQFVRKAKVKGSSPLLDSLTGHRSDEYV